MAEEKKIIRLADVGELEAGLKKDLAEEEAKGKTADILYCESISDELSDLGNLPTIDPKTLRPVAHWEEIPGSYEVCAGESGSWSVPATRCANPECGEANPCGLKTPFCPMCGFRMEDVPDDRFDALAAPWARKIRAAFPAAFVNMYNELILIPKANMYIMLNQVRDERDFKAAVLEDCSRNAFKGCSRKLQDEHLDGINKLLDSKFTRDDIELIYTYLGNGIQHDLCLRFVASGYDLKVLREYDKKQEAGSNGKT